MKPMVRQRQAPPGSDKIFICSSAAGMGFVKAVDERRARAIAERVLTSWAAPFILEKANAADLRTGTAIGYMWIN